MGERQERAHRATGSGAGVNNGDNYARRKTMTTIEEQQADTYTVRMFGAHMSECVDFGQFQDHAYEYPGANGMTTAMLDLFAAGDAETDSPDVNGFRSGDVGAGQMVERPARAYQLNVASQLVQQQGGAASGSGPRRGGIRHETGSLGSRGSHHGHASGVPAVL
jgi:hypothetical protein